MDTAISIIQAVYVGSIVVYLAYTHLQYQRRFMARLRHIDSLYETGQRDKASEAMQQLAKDINNDTL